MIVFGIYHKPYNPIIYYHANVLYQTFDHYTCINRGIKVLSLISLLSVDT